MLPSKLTHRMSSLRIVLCLRTTRLPDGPPRCNTLIDTRRSEEDERGAPAQIWGWIPPCYFTVPFHDLGAGGEAWCRAFVEGGEVAEIGRRDEEVGH